MILSSKNLISCLLGWIFTSILEGSKSRKRTFYNATLSTNARNLVEQYQSAKWGIALTPPGTGADEVTKATASDGYSVFTTRYLERLSQSANVSLQASNTITLDFKGDTLNFTKAGRSLTLTAGNTISTASAGAITTNNGAISLSAANGITIGHAFIFNSGSAATTLATTASGGDIALNAATNTGSATGGLTLSAYRNITLAGALITTNNALTLRSDNTGAGSGAIYVAGNITTNGGNITMGGGSGAITAATGYAVGNATYVDGVTISAALNAAGGNVVVNGRGYGGGSYPNANNGITMKTTGNVLTNATGSITFNGYRW